MSINYHAFQSRGVLFSDCEAVCRQWREAFSGYSPERISGILHLEMDQNYLYVNYFRKRYRLCLENGILEKETEEGWSEAPYFNEAMAVYHLLHYTKETAVISGKWVPSHSLDGVVSRREIPDPLLTPFALRCTGKTEELDAACRKAGGVKLTAGDVAYEFEAFPQVHLRMVFWDADEDFPAQVQILVDQCVTDFLHYETVGCVISDLLEKLEETAD